MHSAFSPCPFRNFSIPLAKFWQRFASFYWLGIIFYDLLQGSFWTKKRSIIRAQWGACLMPMRDESSCLWPTSHLTSICYINSSSIVFWQKICQQLKRVRVVQFHIKMCCIWVLWSVILSTPRKIVSIIVKKKKSFSCQKNKKKRCVWIWRGSLLSSIKYVVGKPSSSIKAI